MFVKLLKKFEKDVLGGNIVANRHIAREDFAMWLDRQAAQTGARWTACTCEQKDQPLVPADWHAENCPWRTSRS